MKDIIPARKQSPILGLTGMGGGVGGNLVAGGSKEFTYVDDVFTPSLYEGNGSDNPVYTGSPNGINLGTTNSGRSVYFNGFNDALKIKNHSDYQIAANDFCLEAWVYHIEAFDNYDVIFGNWTGQESYVFETVGSGDTTELEFYFFDDSNTFVGPIQGGNLTKNTWHHVAVTRATESGNLKFRLFVDGVMHGSGTQNNSTVRSGTGDFLIGTANENYDGTGGQWNGYISNLRLTVGQAIYTANFTPSTEPLTTTSQGATASNVKLLCCQGETAVAATKQTAWPNDVQTQKRGGPAPTAFGPFTAAQASDGGMVWFKNRSNTGSPNIVDTKRGGTQYVFTSSTQAGNDNGYHIKTFDAGGFTVQNNGSGSNQDNENFVGWTFKDHKKFFTQVKYTGTGSTQQIAHNLGSVPGMIMVKQTSNGGGSANWRVYHRKLNDGTNPENYIIYLNLQNGETSEPQAFGAAPTATHFTVGTQGETNLSGQTFMAYLFAHDAGGFGEDDESIVKCDSYVGNGNNNGPEIDFGWEPQYVFIKRATGSEHWMAFDVARQIQNRDGDYDAAPEFDIETSASAVERQSIEWMTVTSTGFKLENGNNHVNGNNDRYIYLAIRRPDGKVGRPATADTAHNYFHSAYSRLSTPNDKTPANTMPFNVDTGLMKEPAAINSWLLGTRQLGTETVNTDLTNKGTNNSYWEWDYPRGWISYTGNNSSWQTWGWKRGITHDVVTFLGNGADDKVITHSMNKVPEMIWVKNRSQTTNWAVYHVGLNGGTNPQNYRVFLNETTAEGIESAYFYNTAPTKTTVTLGSSPVTNGNGNSMVMYLFSSVDGVCKCGSYTGTAATGNVVTTGFRPRFIIIKRVNDTGSWWQIDTTRGITNNGGDLWLLMNTNQTNQTDPLVNLTDTGFTVVDTGTGVNGNNDKYIYYAHA